MSKQSFHDILDSGHTKENRDYIVNVIRHNPARIDELMDCFFYGGKKISQRAAWSVGQIADTNPKILYPYLEKMIDYLDKSSHDAIIRNTFRVFQKINIPEKIEGRVYEEAFDLLVNPTIPVAIRVFAMSTATNIAMKYPDLKEELIQTIEDLITIGSAGFKSRGKRELLRLKKKE